MSLPRSGTASLLIALFAVAGAEAQVLGIGITKGGANPAIGSAIASIVSRHTDMRMRTQAFSSGTRYAPLMDIGEVEFGVGNLSQFALLMQGEFTPNDRPKPNMRLVASLMPFRGGFLVKESSDIRSFADLKGRRVAAGFPGQPLASGVHKAFLANGGLTYEDVVPVPATTMRSHWELFKEGRIDGVMVVVGSGVVKEIRATLGEELRYLSMDNSAESLVKLRDALPGAYFVTIGPNPNLDGAAKQFATLAYDYGLWSGADVLDDTVYRVVKALHQNSDEFRSVGPLMRLYNAEEISRPQVVPYHPGALSYFKEAGLPLARSN